MLSLLISGQVDKASATEVVNSRSITCRVKPKSVKTGIHSFPAWLQRLKRQCEPPAVCGRQVAWVEDRKVPSLSLNQDKLVKNQ